jgi:hypothetical protein
MKPGKLLKDRGGRMKELFNKIKTVSKKKPVKKQLVKKPLTPKKVYQRTY